MLLKSMGYKSDRFHWSKLGRFQKGRANQFQEQPLKPYPLIFSPSVALIFVIKWPYYLVLMDELINPRITHD